MSTRNFVCCAAALGVAMYWLNKRIAATEKLLMKKDSSNKGATTTCACLKPNVRSHLEIAKNLYEPLPCDLIKWILQYNGTRDIQKVRYTRLTCDWFGNGTSVTYFSGKFSCPECGVEFHFHYKEKCVEDANCSKVLPEMVRDHLDLHPASTILVYNAVGDRMDAS
jgi:hypothetical protein